MSAAIPAGTCGACGKPVLLTRWPLRATCGCGACDLPAGFLALGVLR